MTTMQAAVLGDKGVETREVAIPSPGPTEVLVRVRTASLNRADLLMTMGGSHGFGGNSGQPIGMEWAGEVVEAGPDAGGYKPGDRVMCSGMGGFADYAVADHRRCFPVPQAMSWTEATCFPVALRTMVDAVLINGAMQPGAKVMIFGASSGVGLLGMQIAKKCGAEMVIGTSTTPDRRARLGEFGADHAIDPSQEGWPEKIMELTGGKGVDLTVDMLSGPYVNGLLACTALEGRVVNVGRLAGQSGDFNFDLHALRRVKYIGVTFRTRTVEDVEAINRRVRSDVWQMLEAGEFTLPVDREMQLLQAAEALAEMKANTHFGKIVLRAGN